MKALEEKRSDKVSLNIKITPSLNKKLKRTREKAREKGLKFNVSEEVISFLTKLTDRVEKQIDAYEVDLEE